MTTMNDINLLRRINFISALIDMGYSVDIMDPNIDPKIYNLIHKKIKKKISEILLNTVENYNDNHEIRINIDKNYKILL